jgi:PEGA domain-containing protein
MSSDDSEQQQVIVLRVVIRSPDLDTFVSKYSRFVKDDRIFIFTKSSQPPGRRVRFTLELADGTPLIHGEGTVTRIRADSGDSAKPPGMELKFVPLDEHSRDLVARMLRAREGTGQFREETSDVQTAVRDSASPSRREFDEPVPTLAPLEKTGAQPAMSERSESGAVTVTIASNPPREETPPPLPAPTSNPSGSFSSPTPLPAPIPAAAQDFSPPSGAMTRPEKAFGGPAGPITLDQFPAVGPAPAFAEAFRAQLPNGPASTTPPTGTVPANPFSEVSDGAIEYFVEWSMEQSTAPRPKVAEASFANVPMATPRAERRRAARGPLLAGVAVGIFIGLPLGGAAVWYWKPFPSPIVVEKTATPTIAMPQPVAVVAPVATIDLGHAMAVVTPDLGHAIAVVRPDLGAKIAAATKPPATAKLAELQIATKPPGAQITVDGEAQAGKTPLTLKLPTGTHELTVAHERYATVTQTADVPGKLDLTLHRPPATLHVESDPPGGEVIVEGKPRGKTPVDVTLDGFHHYDVQVMLLGTQPWHKRVSLKPPQTAVTAKLSVVHH